MSAGGSSLLMDSRLKYLRNAIHSSFCSIITDPRSLSTESSLGKMPTTSAHRLISLFSLSRGFVEWICL